MHIFILAVSASVDPNAASDLELDLVDLVRRHNGRVLNPLEASLVTTGEIVFGARCKLMDMGRVHHVFLSKTAIDDLPSSAHREK
ncbi:MAG TPA: hypothetical protein VD998_00720 [Verrucomicrobiae bacterium]|nr:hypothetical protein [Verrucomicrobiae bacterium]